MALFELQKATLNGTEGEGYAFARKALTGKAIKGVFFAEDAEALEALQAEEVVTFEGVLYDRKREKQETFSVNVTNVISTPTGERADFVVIEEDE